MESPRLEDDAAQLKYLMDSPIVVIMGKTGAGKTTLCNKLCGTDHKNGSARGSVTVELFENFVNVGDYAFRLIDTPGTDSQVDTFKHALLLREALTCTAVNTIFVVIKYDGRFDNMVKTYYDLEMAV